MRARGHGRAVGVAPRDNRPRRSRDDVFDLLASVERGEWVQRAACRGHDTEMFFPTRGDHASMRAAQAVCATCEVTTECLDYALANGEKVGIWGGLSERQRRAIRSERRMQSTIEQEQLQP